MNPPPRLFAILARDGPVGVVLRRGPSKSVEVIRWDRERDEFTRGAWFNGRIYERRCDLSPDGSLFVYFAATHKGDVAYEGSWTAVSRPPWLTALALWPKGDAWNGGGLFRSNSALWINHGYDGVVAHPDHQPKNLQISTESAGPGEDFPIYGMRLQRDGWEKTSELTTAYDPLEEGAGLRTATSGIWQRSLTTGAILQMIYTVDKARPKWRYQLVVDRQETPIKGADWADVDADRGLVFAAQGKMYRVPAGGGDLSEAREIQDFTQDKPTRTHSPAWARSWD